MEQDYIEVPLFSRDEIYLPIWEENSAPLEVQVGCSWHRCRFCDFALDLLKVFSPPEVEAKAQMLAATMPYARRVFLLGENPLSLPFYALHGIFDIVATFMPQVSEIAMYARFDDVMAKTDEELEELAERGLVELHIGLESGSQAVLDLMNKGIDLSEAARACERLHRLGIDFSFTMIAGLGGRPLSEEHALKSAAFLNLVQPRRVWVTGLLLWPNTPLFDMADRGEFEQVTFRERLVEMRTMVAGLELDNCTFVDSTVLGQYTVRGDLPEQKDAILQAMDQLLALPGGDEVPPIPSRRA